MTLQEKAFMCELIKKNYRRRMSWFFLNVLIFLISFSLTSLAIVTKMAGSIQVISLMVTAFTVVPQILLNADDINLPWIVKKRQSEALQAYSKSDFEELACSVPLQEYFNV